MKLFETIVWAKLLAKFIKKISEETKKTIKYNEIIFSERKTNDSIISEQLMIELHY
jgi:hypothetical protein